MKTVNTIITAHRLKESVADYTVLVRSSGNGAVDVSLWLNDEEARRLGQQLLAASEVIPDTADTEVA